jgi:ubiquinone/menaquinone biosynthesis C-methylase UbiE
MLKEKLKSILPAVGKENEQNRIKWVESILCSIPKDSVILDAGAGERRYKNACSHLKYIASDFGQYDGKGDIGLQTGSWNNEGLDIVCDIANIPLPDNSVDAILCTEVFEHLSNPIEAIKEFSRLLKPNGKLILSAPFASLVHFAPYYFYSGFSRYFYEKHLPENGFEIERLEFNGNFFEYLAQEIRRLPYICQKYANKKISIFYKLFIAFLLFLLQKMSKKEMNSQELLCFGCHVLAKKVSK